MHAVQGYTAIVIERVGANGGRDGQAKALLMSSAVNQDGRSGGLTVCAAAQITCLYQCWPVCPCMDTPCICNLSTASACKLDVRLLQLLNGKFACVQCPLALSMVGLLIG